MAKLSLAEQISQLANPKPKDEDIENFQDRDDDSESGGDVDYDSDLATEHYVKVGKSKIRDDAPALNPKYMAGKVSRQALYDDEEGDGADGFIGSDDEEEEEDSDEEEGNGFIDDEAEDDEDEEEEEEEEGEEEDSDEELSENENDSSARATLKELLREEQKAAKKQAKEATVSDAQKGFAISKQTDLYETLLDARITFQKAVQSANALPISEDKAEEFETEANSLQDTKSKLSDFISQIAKMRYNMAVQEHVFDADAVKLSTKRTFEATLDNMEKLDTEFKAYETSVLTKWSQKVQASSAATALNSSKFKALNQSSANQVAATLADMDRLVKRTRMNRSNVVILGEEQMGAIQDAEGENYYIFDDSDFYRNLLKDLIDRRMVDSGNQSSGVKTWTATKAKTKKAVDTRASKGRKLRYHVQDKVQNFAAPRPVFTWEDDQIDELFAGLLGQQVNFNEDDEGDKEKEKESGDTEELVIPDDGLRIFG